MFKSSKNKPSKIALSDWLVTEKPSDTVTEMDLWKNWQDHVDRNIVRREIYPTTYDCFPLFVAACRELRLATYL
jgi:hypothetical protein